MKHLNSLNWVDENYLYWGGRGGVAIILIGWEGGSASVVDNS